MKKGEKLVELRLKVVSAANVGGAAAAKLGTRCRQGRLPKRKAPLSGRSLSDVACLSRRSFNEDGGEVGSQRFHRAAKDRSPWPLSRKRHARSKAFALLILTTTLCRRLWKMS